VLLVGEPPQLDETPAYGILPRRLRGPQREGVRDANAIEHTTAHPLLQRLDVGNGVGQLRHAR
jgi:hypothetical protein